ncbi:hypothetical protein [Coleofasciculus sp. G2-EDA-02]|uniref:hypothetical protein n=1 Tax=Coleofasciculus sp. G2-EDA-02 TaxID=3069529 RepID=UPI0033018E11
MLRLYITSKSEPRQQPAFRRRYSLFVQHGLAFLLPQGVTLRTSGHILSLAAMFGAEPAYYCYFGISLSDVHTSSSGQQPIK